MIQKKICMVGAFGVGKTSLVSRFVRSIFPEKYQTTIGVKIDKKEVVVDGQRVTLVLWDLAGEDAMTQIRPSHLRGASGYILVADGCRSNTLEVTKDLQRRVQEALGKLPFFLVVNKVDLKDTWELTDAALADLKDQGWGLLYTSAKTGDGVEDLFLDLSRQMLKEENAESHSISPGT